MYYTSCSSSELLAKKIHTELHIEGIRFPQLFPYNRFSTDSSAWWACEKGTIPAYSRMKLCFTPTNYNGMKAFFVGVGVEKGFGQQHGTANQKMTTDWDWFDYISKIRSKRFEVIEKQCSDWFGSVASTLLDPKLRNRIERKVYTKEELVSCVDVIENHRQKEWFWCDLYIGAMLIVDESKENEEQFISSFLIPMVQFFWPNIQKN